MKIKIHHQVPNGFVATNELRIFSPIDNPEVCVMAQRHVRSLQLVSESETSRAVESAWVAVQTERVDKIIFA